VVHFDGSGSINRKGGQLHMLIVVNLSFTYIFYMCSDLWELPKVLCGDSSHLPVVTMKKTSFHERSKVIALSEKLFSQHFIVGHLHISHSRVGSILTWFNENGQVHDHLRLGQPRLLSIWDERLTMRTLN